MMCSFAKFLALGLIASESHGPVFAEAITVEQYKYVVGMPPANTANTGGDARRAQACGKMNEAYHAEKQTDLTGWTTTACTTTLYDKYKSQMIAEIWRPEATKLGLKSQSSSWKVDTDPNGNDKDNVKYELINALTGKLTGLGGRYSFDGNYYKQIKDLKKVVEVEEKLQLQSFLPRMKILKAVLLQVEKDVLDAKVKSEAAVLLGNTEIILNSLEQAVRTADENKIKYWQDNLLTWETRANDLTVFVQKEKATAEAEKAETLGGVFGVLAAAVVGAFIFLVSPCMMFNWNNGTVKGDPMWSRDVFYGEKYGKDVNGEEIKGLDGKEIKESSSSSSALTLVPVGFLAVGVLAVARRGLNKRRAQKKAKRASRAQERLHEDL